MELRELGDASGRLASGHPSIVLVEGEAGIGKTRLLADALADARSRGLQVVTGQTQELERALQALDTAGARRLVLGGLDDRAVSSW